MRTTLALVVFAFIVGACSQLASGEREVACSVTGSVRFDPAVLDGPEFTKERFLETREGQTLDAFFIGGIGEPEGEMYAGADGFTVLGGGTVLGHTAGMPTAYFNLDDGDIQSWGGCRPQWVWGDRAAARFQVASDVDANRTVLPIVIEGGGCVVDGEVDIITTVADVEVVETGDTIEIRPWTRERGFRFECAGVGVGIDHEVMLTAPIGNRLILDRGLIPPQPAERGR